MMGGQIVYVALVIILHCTMEATHNKMSFSGWSGATGCNKHKSNDDLFGAADDQFESVEVTAHLPAVDQPPAVKGFKLHEEDRAVYLSELGTITTGNRNGYD